MAEHAGRTGKQRRSREARRLGGIFILSGLAMLVLGGLFVGWAFADDVGPTDWILMHRAKLDVVFGVGLGGIGAVFLCFGGVVGLIAAMDDRR
ncbi:hypothetical protein EDF56_105336 [Novosphingobium sp. PhB165]|uniref:hypothetical protein n=1 Tax=Novosphingobium sp. PhB165 TaxID=2485105 RepID=UPI001052AB0C|nr:hypothetical protein [Novosphingobium sp. PhB165]TCM17988.1 hypothetical protein EDF56_105336 [Novosphingobium sp. PhB165]